MAGNAIAGVPQSGTDWRLLMMDDWRGPKAESGEIGCSHSWAADGMCRDLPIHGRVGAPNKTNSRRPRLLRRCVSRNDVAGKLGEAVLSNKANLQGGGLGLGKIGKLCCL